MESSGSDDSSAKSSKHEGRRKSQRDDKEKQVVGNWQFEATLHPNLSKKSRKGPEPQKSASDRHKRGTKEKVPVVVNVTEEGRIGSDTRMRNRSHGPTSESTSGGIHPGEMDHPGYKDGSDASQGARPSTSFSDKRSGVSKAQVKKLKKKLSRKDNELNSIRKELEILKGDLNDTSRKIKQLEEEKNDLLNRLSSEAAARMMYDNPNITDLSDQDRPTKISERYSELYDNQWTDAFDNLQRKHHLTDTETIEFLLDVLYVSFVECREARSQREDALKALKKYIGSDVDAQDLTVLEVMRTLKGAKKRNMKKKQEEFMKSVQEKLARKTNYTEKLQDIGPYLDECVEICLLMNVQEPPLELRGLTLSVCTPFDSSAFKPYTENGKKIKYVVWPAMHLYLDGPLLCKGVAQGMPDPSNVHNPTSVNHDANVKELDKEVNGEQAEHKQEYTNDRGPNCKTVKNEKKNEIVTHNKNLKTSSTLTGSHRENSSHQSQKNITEKSKTQYDKPGSSISTYALGMETIRL